MQSDQVLLFAPMTNLAWQQVHSGHLPLWNPYNVLGTPLAFNWESAVFSLPVLISYLVHASFAYTVVVLVKLVIAGSGAYVRCRALGLRPISSALGGTAFELSGTILHYSGWAVSGVECWYGWIFGAAVLLIRGNHRARDTVVMAVAVAFAIYGGYPAALVFPRFRSCCSASCSSCFAPPEAGLDSSRWQTSQSPASVDLRWAHRFFCRAGRRPMARRGRSRSGSSASFPASHITNLLAVGLQGKNFKTAAYVGVIAIVLAVIAIRMTWRRPRTRLGTRRCGDGRVHLLGSGRQGSAISPVWDDGPLGPGRWDAHVGIDAAGRHRIRLSAR